MVSSGPSQHQAGLGPHTSMQGPAQMRAASWAYGSRKKAIPKPDVCRFTAGRPVPCTKALLLYLVPYFLNAHLKCAAQSSFAASKTSSPVTLYRLWV